MYMYTRNNCLCLTHINMTIYVYRTFIVEKCPPPRTPESHKYSPSPPPLFSYWPICCCFQTWLYLCVHVCASVCTSSRQRESKKILGGGGKGEGEGEGEGKTEREGEGEGEGEEEEEGGTVFIRALLAAHAHIYHMLIVRFCQIFGRFKRRWRQTSHQQTTIHKISKSWGHTEAQSVSLQHDLTPLLPRMLQI